MLFTDVMSCCVGRVAQVLITDVMSCVCRSSGPGVVY